jgi:hypothetical protein
MPVKYPYQGLMMTDERNKVMRNVGRGSDYHMDDYKPDQGINAEPTDGPTEGVVSAKRLNPHHHIKSGSCD